MELKSAEEGEGFGEVGEEVGREGHEGVGVGVGLREGPSGHGCRSDEDGVHYFYSVRSKYAMSDRSDKISSCRVRLLTLVLLRIERFWRPSIGGTYAQTLGSGLDALLSR